MHFILEIVSVKLKHVCVTWRDAEARRSRVPCVTPSLPRSADMRMCVCVCVTRVWNNVLSIDYYNVLHVVSAIRTYGAYVRGECGNICGRSSAH